MYKLQWIVLLSYFLYLNVQSREIHLIDKENNSTIEDSLPTWANEQMLVCLISVPLGTCLFFVTFIVPITIIVHRSRCNKNRFDLRELRRMSDFV